ncbi:unnamed protein product [Meloidogyne enterolobii]|uniref:Uncharacterized protein n=1 Tax=Meloidogyne enterolobii TaxID=390850 RepID=A0ACB1AJP0_MELEN
MNESLFSLNMEKQKHIEIGKQLSAILTHVIPMLPKEQQGCAMLAMSKAKHFNLLENEQGNLFQQSYLRQTMPFTNGGTRKEALIKISNNLSKNSTLDTSATNDWTLPWPTQYPFNSNLTFPALSSSWLYNLPINFGNKSEIEFKKFLFADLSAIICGQVCINLRT